MSVTLGDEAAVEAAADPNRAEPGHRLDDPQPRTLGLLDQAALWGNLGISLLGPVTAAAILVVAPGLSLAAAFVAIIAGTAIGGLGLALANLAGARSGKPAMVLLRGLFGARLSYAPTVLNLVQVLGWGIFEIVVIAQAAAQLLPWHAHWPYIVIGGALTTLMAVRPLGAIRILRRYALVAVVAAIVYLLVQLSRSPLPPLTRGTWHGFWLGVDLVIAVTVSWVPLAADYARHARSPRTAFAGSFAGYGITQVLCYTLGIVALATVASKDPSQAGMFAAFIAVPVGWLPFAALLVRELDESFADVYSTAISVQNLRPRWDRRVLAVVVGVISVGGAFWLDHQGSFQSAYSNFLTLIGSVFIPMFAVFVVRYFLFRDGATWDTSESAPSRWALLVPWVIGFVAYQMLNPGLVSWWATIWTHAQSWLGFTPPTWASASIASFLVAAVVTVLLAPLTRRSAA